MELTHSFTVPAAIDVAWAAFNDLERIAPCFPGAALTSYDGEVFEGLCKVKLGPISLQYNGTGRFVERDEAAHRAVIEAKGKDKRGNGTAAASVTATLQSAGDAATDVKVVTDLSITGKPAQFGRGVMQDVSDKLLAQFSACLEVKLGSSEAAQPGQEEAATMPAADGEDTPIAKQAARAVMSAASETSATAAPSSLPSASSSPSASRRPAPTETPAAELDLGATVLPVLVKRYAPYLIGALVGLWLLRKIFRRS